MAFLPNYSSASASDLWQQIQMRKGQGSKAFEGLTDKSPSSDMANALLADDKERAASAKPMMVPGEKSADEVREQRGQFAPTSGRVSDFKHGFARREFGHIPVPDKKNPKKSALPKIEGGAIFRVCKHAPDGYNNTVTCMNGAHTWQGTEVQYRQFFTPVDSPEQPTKNEPAPADEAGDDPSKKKDDETAE